MPVARCPSLGSTGVLLTGKRTVTPDSVSGNGGYFTQEESDSSGSGSPGSSSPPTVSSGHLPVHGTRPVLLAAPGASPAMYRLQRKPEQRDTRRQKSSLVSYHEVRARSSEVRSSHQSAPPICPRASRTSSVPGRRPLPPRPPPALQPHPPLPNKHNISHTSTSRLPKPPPRGVPRVKPLVKLAPLQMQSPSMMMALRRASGGSREEMTQTRRSSSVQDSDRKNLLNSTRSSSTATIPRQSKTTPPAKTSRTPKTFTNISPRSSPRVSPTSSNKSTPSSSAKSSPASSIRSSPNTTTKRTKLPLHTSSNMSFRLSNSPSMSKYSSNLSTVPSSGTALQGRVLEGVRKPAAQLSRRPVGPQLQGPRSRLSVSTPRSTAEAGMASLRNSSKKSVQTDRSPSGIKSSFSGNAELQRHSTETKVPNKSEKVFPSNPVQNLIKIYEEESGQPARGGHGQLGPSSVTREKTTFPGGAGTEPGVPNSVDEFLASASKAQSKYQQMLVTPPSSPHPQSSTDFASHSPPVVQTSPTDTELQSGCFTDVSFAGSFAGCHSPVEDEKRRGGKKDNEDGHGTNSGTFTEISYAGSFASTGSKSSSSSCSPVQSEEPPPPVPERGVVPIPPSPRISKRQRREQLLQEHKTLGREIVLTALRKDDEGEQKKERGIFGNRNEERNDEVEKREGSWDKERSEYKRIQVEREEEQKQLRKMLTEREEEISALRAACEGWRGKTLAVERELSEANFTVSKLERSLRTIELKQEELDESHTSFIGEIQSRESAMDQLREGMQEMRSRYVRKEQEEAQKDAVIRDQAATIKKLEEAVDNVSLSSPISRTYDEIDELRSELFILEKEMEKSKKQLASVKTLHRAEIETLEQDKESARFHLTKKVKALEDELERVQDELGTMVSHQNLLEEKVAKLSSKTDYHGVISKLQLDVKQKTVLLLDAESMLEQRESDSSSKLLVRQLKIQVEEAGAEVVTGLRAKKNLELELADTNAQMEEVSAARAATEGRFLEQVRENARLSSQVGEQEEELTQLMKQYRASAGNVATYMITLQEQAVIIQSLEMERDTAREEAAELRARISELEEAARESRNLKDGERREGELLRRLELEETNRKRAETRVIRLLEELEDGARKRAEDDRKGADAEKRQRKLVADFRKLQEEYAALQTHIIESDEARAVLEGRLQVSLVELKQVQLALGAEQRRVAGLQAALLVESDGESEGARSGGEDSSLEQVDLILRSHHRQLSESAVLYSGD